MHSTWDMLLIQSRANTLESFTISNYYEGRISTMNHSSLLPTTTLWLIVKDQTVNQDLRKHEVSPISNTQVRYIFIYLTI